MVSLFCPDEMSPNGWANALPDLQQAEREMVEQQNRSCKKKELSPEGKDPAEVRTRTGLRSIHCDQAVNEYLTPKGRLCQACHPAGVLLSFRCIH